MIAYNGEITCRSELDSDVIDGPPYNMWCNFRVSVVRNTIYVQHLLSGDQAYVSSPALSLCGLNEDAHSQQGHHPMLVSHEQMHLEPSICYGKGLFEAGCKDFS